MQVQAVLQKAQRRSADVQRLVRKALKAIEEARATPRPDLPSDTAAEIDSLRRQIKEAHETRRKEADLVRKYEQRWAELKASARKKKQQQAQAQLRLPPPPPQPQQLS